MKIRHKLWIAMTAMILLMGGAFFGISHGYLENLFRQYATGAEEAVADQWAQQMAYYYEHNGGSWGGVNQYLAELLQELPNSRVGFNSLTLQDNQGNVMVHAGTPGHQSGNMDTVTVPVEVGTVKVGSLTLGSRIQRGSAVEQTKQSVLHSMTVATVWGIIVTSLVAFLMGLWFVRIITKRLHSMTAAMRRIQEGDLEARVDISSKDEFGEVADTFNEMTRRLSRTEEARRHLVADVAHELRTPLTIMQGQLELIQQGVKPAEPASLLPIQDEVVRLSRLVQDLHQLSLAEVGKLPLEKKSTDISQILQRILFNFEVEADERDVQLAYSSSADGPVVALIDPNRITQVFVNLIGNALRYTPGGGKVRVYVEKATNTVKVSVADTGSGIPEEHLQHVFDRFYRAEEDRSRGTGGSGLGLAIAKEFVEAHGGRIEVESTVGRGTTFNVYLPGNTLD